MTGPITDQPISTKTNLELLQGVQVMLQRGIKAVEKAAPVSNSSVAAPPSSRNQTPLVSPRWIVSPPMSPARPAPTSFIIVRSNGSHGTASAQPSYAPPPRSISATPPVPMVLTSLTPPVPVPLIRPPVSVTTVTAPITSAIPPVVSSTRSVTPHTPLISSSRWVRLDAPSAVATTVVPTTAASSTSKSVVPPVAKISLTSASGTSTPVVPGPCVIVKPPSTAVSSTRTAKENFTPPSVMIALSSASDAARQLDSSRKARSTERETPVSCAPGCIASTVSSGRTSPDLAVDQTTFNETAVAKTIPAVTPRPRVLPPSSGSAVPDRTPPVPGLFESLKGNSHRVRQDCSPARFVCEPVTAGSLAMPRFLPASSPPLSMTPPVPVTFLTPAATTAVAERR
eukprot:TRINITY_DN7933_c4_g1_i1.p1 TRINITY_DN7933_c4_g1~~TRINITY_DN7933_c4_g1_i1.p1  ORF type:complete len:446 (+),score=38.70 TRINITY_DN7933_c4_g1_i1:147-1340(+)